jgi:hypothetical protein
MNTFGNLKASFGGSARVGSVAAAFALLAPLACGSSIDTPNPTSSAGSPSGGTSAAAGGASSGNNATAGQTARGGQTSTAGQSSSAGQTAMAGQSSNGGQEAKGGQTGTGGQSSAGTGGGGSGSSSGGTASGGTASGGAGSCPHVPLKGGDICTIGDSWIQLQGNQVTTLENHMKTAGVIPQGDHFDRREVSGSTLSSIIATYSNKPSSCKVLVMDGGGIDLFTTAAGDQAAIAPVVQKFKDFLAKVKADGYVQHIIYSLYPVIPSTRNLNVNMKPGFSAACDASAVDCHLVDLEPLFMGQHFASDNTHADVAGGVIIGDAWWKAMQQSCIAQ